MPQTTFLSATTNTTTSNTTSMLPPSYNIRKLREDDYDNGYLDVLSQLTTVGPITREDFSKQLKLMQSLNDCYHTLVITNSDGRVVASGSLVIEHKFIHSLGMLGHIEDVVVDKNERRGGIGKGIISGLKDLAFQIGCYKITLDCSKDNEAFYLKNDFKCNGLQMCIYNNNKL